MKNFLNTLREIARYPSAIFGSLIIFALIVASIVVIVKIPYQTAIDRWRGGEEVWGKILAQFPLPGPTGSENPNWWNHLTCMKVMKV